ncbi:MAG: hypothetical protein AB8I08_12465 [Sandaracinaceae bacterium]
MRHLDVVQVDDPCPLPWDALKGDGPVRYCGTCAHNVYDLSQMSEREAEQLIETHEGRLCVQYYARADGTVITADCTPSRLAQARRAARRAMLGAGALMAALLAFTLGLAAVVVGWVSRETAAPVVAQLEEASKVFKPLEPMLPLPVVETPVEPQRPIRHLRGRYAPPRPRLAPRAD